MHTHLHSQNYNKIFLFGIILNLIYILTEIFFGLRFNSTALVSDATHNAGDVASLVFSWLAFKYSTKKPTANFTYGLRRSTILIALLNSLLLFAAMAFILEESINRISTPVSVPGLGIALVAFSGIIINGITAGLFFGGSKKDLNIKGAYLHMMADALVSAGVVLSGILIYYTDLFIIDTITSIIILLIIIYSSWGLFKDALNLALDAVPKGINLNQIQNYLESIDGVKDVHHLHVWAMSTTENALTVHLVFPGYNSKSDLTNIIREQLHEKFSIDHCTIQIEYTKEDDDDCMNIDNDQN